MTPSQGRAPSDAKADEKALKAAGFARVGIRANEHSSFLRAVCPHSGSVPFLVFEASLPHAVRIHCRGRTAPEMRAVEASCHGMMRCPCRAATPIAAATTFTMRNEGTNERSRARWAEPKTNMSVGQLSTLPCVALLPAFFSCVRLSKSYE